MLGSEAATILLFFVCCTVQQLSNGQGQVPVVFNVRLAGGTTNKDGRVEIQYNGVWGTICDDGWSVLDAGVVCRMLGFVGPAKELKGGVYPAGPASMPVWLRAVQCDGNEANLGSCPYQGFNNTGCPHTQDAGVVCFGDLVPTTMTTTRGTTGTTLPPTICNNPSTNVRLLNAAGTVVQAQGRVQVLYNTSWRSICNDRWDVMDARVVCRMLCYNPDNAKAIIATGAYGNATEGFWFSGVNCAGTETDIINGCPHSSFGVSNCNTDEAAAVSCTLDTPTPPPLPAPTLDCSSEKLTARFTKSDNPRLNETGLSVSDSNGGTLPNCQYTTSSNSDSVFISIPFIGGNCNTTRQMNDTYILYTNVIRYEVPDPSSVITRSDIYYVTVNCLINRTQDPDNSFNPQSRTAPPQTGGGRYNVSLLLFADGSFKEVVRDNPLRVVLGDWVYAGVQLFSSDPNLKLVLQDLYVTPYADPNSQPMYFLIRSKCREEPTLTMYPMNDTLFAVRFQSFKFVTNYTYMYMHSNVQVCGVNENTGLCNRNCPTQARKRREVGLYPSVLVSSGTALTFREVSGSEGVAQSESPTRKPSPPDNWGDIEVDDYDADDIKPVHENQWPFLKSGASTTVYKVQEVKVISALILLTTITLLISKGSG